MRPVVIPDAVRQSPVLRNSRGCFTALDLSISEDEHSIIKVPPIPSQLPQPIPNLDSSSLIQEHEMSKTDVIPLLGEMSSLDNNNDHFLPEISTGLTKPAMLIQPARPGSRTSVQNTAAWHEITTTVKSDTRNYAGHGMRTHRRDTSSHNGLPTSNIDAHSMKSLIYQTESLSIKSIDDRDWLCDLCSVSIDDCDCAKSHTKYSKQNKNQKDDLQNNVKSSGGVINTANNARGININTDTESINNKVARNESYLRIALPDIGNGIIPNRFGKTIQIVKQPGPYSSTGILSSSGNSSVVASGVLPVVSIDKKSRPAGKSSFEDRDGDVVNNLRNDAESVWESGSNRKLIKPGKSRYVNSDVFEIPSRLPCAENDWFVCRRTVSRDRKRNGQSGNEIKYKDTSANVEQLGETQNTRTKKPTLASNAMGNLSTIRRSATCSSISLNMVNQPNERVLDDNNSVLSEEDLGICESPDQMAPIEKFPRSLSFDNQPDMLKCVNCVDIDSHVKITNNTQALSTAMTEEHDTDKLLTKVASCTDDGFFDQNLSSRTHDEKDIIQLPRHFVHDYPMSKVAQNRKRRLKKGRKQGNPESALRNNRAFSDPGASPRTTRTSTKNGTLNRSTSEASSNQQYRNAQAGDKSQSEHSTLFIGHVLEVGRMIVDPIGYHQDKFFSSDEQLSDNSMNDVERYLYERVTTPEVSHRMGRSKTEFNPVSTLGFIETHEHFFNSKYRIYCV